MAAPRPPRDPVNRKRAPGDPAPRERSARGGGSARPPREEQTVYGVKAALAVLEHRPADVRRIFHVPALRQVLGPHLAAAAARHLPYRELAPEELARVAGGPHHEGLVVVAAPLRYRRPALPPLPGAALWLALDRVENPHNLGALVRTAAFFGLTGVLVGGAAPGEKVNAAVLRVAEGGAEHVPLFGAGVLTEHLAALREGGCRVLGLETDAPQTLAAALPGVRADAPLALVLGHERDGLSAAARRACDGLCTLRGAGSLPSLNVAVAAAVALSEALRGRPAPAQRRREPPSAPPVVAPPPPPRRPKTGRRIRSQERKD